ncbi:MAG: hypothetical protein J6Z18_01805 [Prevotella sp.]|nr:hypothetical protein [Prevotella sp.]
MKKLLFLSLALIFGVFVGFALKPVPVTTKTQTTNTVKEIGSPGTLTKTPVGATSTTESDRADDPITIVGGKKGTGTAVTNVINTTAGKTTNTGVGKTVIPGNSKVVPSTTIGGVGGATLDKGDLNGGTNPVAKEDDGNPSTTFSIADYMPTTEGTKTTVANPVIGTPKTTLKTGTVKETQDVMKR